jgi:hypothetical protein
MRQTIGATLLPSRRHRRRAAGGADVCTPRPLHRPLVDLQTAPSPSDWELRSPGGIASGAGKRRGTTARPRARSPRPRSREGVARAHHLRPGRGGVPCPRLPAGALAASGPSSGVPAEPTALAAQNAASAPHPLAQHEGSGRVLGAGGSGGKASTWRRWSTTAEAGWAEAPGGDHVARFRIGISRAIPAPDGPSPRSAPSRSKAEPRSRATRRNALTPTREIFSSVQERPDFSTPFVQFGGALPLPWSLPHTAAGAQCGSAAPRQAQFRSRPGAAVAPAARALEAAASLRDLTASRAAAPRRAALRASYAPSGRASTSRPTVCWPARCRRAAPGRHLMD